MRRPVAAVTVDVDGLDLYAGLHGLPASVAGPQAWTRGVRRFLDLFDRRGIPATFFVVGQDVQSPGPARELAQEAARRGHELGNHSRSHPYDLLALSPEARRSELLGGADLIEEACGQRPRGFRSPGYALDDDLLRLIEATGHVYDSSLLPCPPYAIAKWLKMALMRGQGRSSIAAGGFAGALGRRRPHRPTATPGIVEAPIATTRALRLPVIGATLLHMGQGWFRRVLPGLIRSSPLVNIELHAVDLVGVVEDGLHPSLALFPDPGGMSLSRKAATLEACLDLLGERCRFDTLGGAVGGLP